MTEDEDAARRRIEHLADEYLRRRRPTTRHHPMDDGYYEVTYALERLRRADEVLEFIRATRRDPYTTFTNLPQVLDDSREGLTFSKRVLDETGFLELLDDHFSTLMSGVSGAGLPPEEADLLDMLGFTHLAATVREVVDLVAYEWTQGSGPGISLTLDFQRNPATRAFDQAIDQIDRHSAELREQEARQSNPDVRPRAGSDISKPRRWWKGLGQIVEGAALAVADAGLAIGAFKFPVDDATRTYGAAISVTAGIGKVANGVGDLRGE